MGYENDFLADSDELDSDEEDFAPLLTDIEEGDDPLPVDLELDVSEWTKKTKIIATRFSLKTRRAIEEHWEHRRLRREFDYFSEQ